MIDRKYERTFPLTRLYHQFLSRHRAPSHCLTMLANLLHAHSFIDTIGIDRYAELDKIKHREHSDELFKIINQVVTEGKKWN